jgi:dihydrofolate reductase
MRKIRYAVAMSLDGYIAGPEGEADWLILDPEIDFRAIFFQFDTVLLGRRTYEAMGKAGKIAMPGMKSVVFSRTLLPSDHPDVTIASNLEELHSLRTSPGKDIWLLGGGSLFHSLLEADLVDTVEVSIIPLLLGSGVPFLPSPAKRTELRLYRHNIYKSGMVSLIYAVT